MTASTSPLSLGAARTRRIFHAAACVIAACVLIAVPGVPRGWSQGVSDPLRDTGGAGVLAPEASRRSVIRFLTDTDFAPFNYLDEEGALTGFNIDLARAVCLELSATCDIKAKPWAELLPALQKGEADAVIAGHAVTPQALVEVAFTDRYFHMPGRFAAPRDQPNIEATPSGLYRKRIAVAQGTAHEAFLRDFFRDSQILAEETEQQARNLLLERKADVLFGDGVALVLWINGTASRECCELRGGPFLEPRYFGDGMAIAVSKSDPQMQTLINDALRRVRAGGRLEELMLRYFPIRIY